LREQLVNHAEALGLRGQVKFSGFAQYAELPALYAGAGALILPSTSDQWGLVVNEAMAAGLPVLISNSCGCSPELVVEGVTGFSFDPRDEAQLASRMSALTSLSGEQRHAMGRAAAARVRAFSLEAFSSGLWCAASCARSRPVHGAAATLALLGMLLLTGVGRRNMRRT
jgi:1,2-diacylglycerol 3-alpha-glucosyltransferase